MGCASSNNTHEDALNRDIDREMENNHRKQSSEIKLLLLGAGESGKSTIFKQMKTIYGNIYDDTELKNLVPVIHNNVLQNFLLVLANVPVHKQEVACKDVFDNFTKNINEDTPLTPEIVADIKTLWADPGVMKTWELRSTYQVLDSLTYYCKHKNLDRIGDPKYLPNEMDIFQARVRTSGIVEENYNVDGVIFTMYDVGGQRNERKKWIHCFDNATAVIFVAAISEYDQVLYEDNKTQRIGEAVKLFDDICNSAWFKNTSMILFLNKSDLFEAKLPRIPYRLKGVRNEDFEGPHAGEGAPLAECIEAATHHILDKFLAVNRDSEKEIYHHVTCAIDTGQILVVFNACKDIILRSNLVSSGFMQ